MLLSLGLKKFELGYWEHLEMRLWREKNIIRTVIVGLRGSQPMMSQEGVYFQPQLTIPPPSAADFSW